MQKRAQFFQFLKLVYKMFHTFALCEYWIEDRYMKQLYDIESDTYIDWSDAYINVEEMKYIRRIPNQNIVNTIGHLQSLLDVPWNSPLVSKHMAVEIPTLVKDAKSYLIYWKTLNKLQILHALNGTIVSFRSVILEKAEQIYMTSGGLVIAFMFDKPSIVFDKELQQLHTFQFSENHDNVCILPPSSENKKWLSLMLADYLIFDLVHSIVAYLSTNEIIACIDTTRFQNSIY